MNDLVTRALAVEITWEIAKEINGVDVVALPHRTVAQQPTPPQSDFAFMKREPATVHLEVHHSTDSHNYARDTADNPNQPRAVPITRVPQTY